MADILRADRVGSDMTVGPLFRKLIIFALPIVFTQLIQQLYNTVDLIIVGQFGGSTGTVGVATGGEFVNFLTNASNGFAMAGQVYIAQLTGAKQIRKVTETIGTLITFMAVLSVVCAVAVIALCYPALALLNCPPEAFSQARSYMIITAFGMPFIFLYNAVSGCLRGMGESKKPLIFVTVAAVSNIFLDLLLVAIIPLGAAGTAIATVAAQFFSCAAAIVYMYRNRERFDFGFRAADFRIRRDVLATLLRLGIPKALKFSAINLTMIFCSSQINSYGLIASATNSVGNKITKFCNVLMYGIDQGVSTTIGQNLGARRPERAKRAVYYALAIALGLCVVNVCLCIFLPAQVFSVFNRDPEVVAMGVRFMRLQIFTFIFSAIMGPYQAMVAGCGNANLELVIGLLDGVVLRLSISLILTHVFGMGVWGFFYGNVFARLGPVVISLIYYYSGAWQRRRLLTDPAAPPAAEEQS